VEELEVAAVLFAAGSDCGPLALVVALASIAACTLRDAAVDYTVPELLLTMLMGSTPSANMKRK
jgi:hypothetical protein